MIHLLTILVFFFAILHWKLVSFDSIWNFISLHYVSQEYYRSTHFGGLLCREGLGTDSQGCMVFLLYTFPVSHHFETMSLCLYLVGSWNGFVFICEGLVEWVLCVSTGCGFLFLMIIRFGFLLNFGFPFLELSLSISVFIETVLSTCGSWRF